MIKTLQTNFSENKNYSLLNEVIPFFYTKDRRYLYFTRERVLWFLAQDFQVQ